MSRSALILIDIQNDFLPGGALAIGDGDAIIPVANSAQKHFDLVIASKDWHPRHHASFAMNHPGKRVGDMIDLEGQEQILWPAHCVQETPGAEFPPSLDTSRVAHIVHKGTDPNIDSYSALFDNGHRKSTGLADYLRAQRVTDVYVLGLATDYCVKFTALDALREGFTVHLIGDGCRGVNLKPDDVRDAIAEMRHAGATIMTSKSLPRRERL